MTQDAKQPVHRQRWMSKAMVVKITGVTLLLLAAFVIITYYTDDARGPGAAPATAVTVQQRNGALGRP